MATQINPNEFKDEETTIDETNPEQPDDENKIPPSGSHEILPIKIWASIGDRQVMNELAKLYRLNNYTEIVRFSIREALRKEEEREENQTLYERLYAELSQRLDRMSKHMDGTIKEPAENQDQEDTGPYDPEILAYFEKLDNRGKKYLAEALQKRLNPRGSYKFRWVQDPAWQEEIETRIRQLCPYERTAQGIRETQKARKELLAYLQGKSILPQK